jgi:hypothetical protein
MLLQNENYLDDFFEKTTIPFIYFSQDKIESKKQLAIYVHRLESSLLLIPTSWMFSFPAVIAGLSFEKVNYVASKAPDAYKKELLETVKTEYKIKEIFEIAKSMDDDLGDQIKQNQERVKNVIQYVKDNQIAFEF